MGINNTLSVRETIGSRICAARKDKNLSRPAFVNLLLQNKLCPEVTRQMNTSEIKTPVEVLTNRLRQWENGNNPVDLEYIPAICDVLECDVGYLFGYYDEKYHVVADITAITGLSEMNIGRLITMQRKFGPTLKNVPDICIESAWDSLSNFLLLMVASENCLTSKKAKQNGDQLSVLAEQTSLAERAKEFGLTTLLHEDAAKFYIRSITSTLEQHLEEAYLHGID